MEKQAAVFCTLLRSTSKMPAGIWHGFVSLSNKVPLNLDMYVDLLGLVGGKNEYPIQWESDRLVTMTEWSWKWRVTMPLTQHLRGTKCLGLCLLRFWRDWIQKRTRDWWIRGKQWFIEARWSRNMKSWLVNSVSKVILWRGSWGQIRQAGLARKSGRAKKHSWTTCLERQSSDTAGQERADIKRCRIVDWTQVGMEKNLKFYSEFNREPMKRS